MASDMIPSYGHCDAKFAIVRDLFREGFEGDREIGAAVAFYLDGRPVVDLWGGHYDAERTREWERDTLVNTYSTTKGMTALCANQLIDAGRLDVDAPVRRYWPEFAAAGKEDVSVRDLLSHKAGLPGVSELLPDDALYDWDRMTAALAAQEPWWTPGEKHGYHAVTFGFLVGELVRRVSGVSLGTFFRRQVAGPLEADFHIGLEDAHDPRTSNLHGGFGALQGLSKGGRGAPRIKGPLGDMLRDMQDPTTMTGSAFSNPPLRNDSVNSRAFRAAEIPAVNGHGTARSLARIYGALACGGALDGVRLISSQAIDDAIEEQAFGPDAVLGGLPMRFGLGFILRHDVIPLSPGPRAFGHPGAGGSIGMADPDARVGFGFTMNRMQMGILGSASAFGMIRAFFDALGVPDAA